MKFWYGKRPLFFFLTAIFLLSGSIFPLTAATGNESLNFILQNADFRTSTQNLSNADGSVFPRNVIVTFPTRVKTGIKRKNTITFCFSKEYALSHRDFTLTMLHDLKEMELPFTLEVAFCANDENLPGLSEKESNLTGTEIFAESSEQTEDLYVIVFIPQEEGAPEKQILAGSPSDNSPAFLVRTLANACSLNGVEYSLPPSYGFLFKRGVYPSHKRLESFLSREIASSAITIGSGEEDRAVIKSIAELLSKQRLPEWDRHYSHIPLGANGIWPGEIFYILLIIIVAGITLFGFCFSPFIKKNQHNAVRKDFFRSWYFLPLQIAVLTTVLLLGNLIFSFFKNSPLAFIIAKITLTLFITFTLMWLQVFHKIKISFPALGYQMQLTAAFNLIISFCIDITLLFPFLMQYLIIWSFRRARSRAALCVEMLLIFLPLIFPWKEILWFGAPQPLYAFFKGSILSNLTLAFFISPMTTLWQRILILTQAHRRQGEKTLLSHRITAAALDTGTSVLLISAAFMLVSFTLYPSGKNIVKETPLYQRECEDSQKFFSMTHTESEFMDISSHHIKILPKEKVSRFTVYAEGNRGFSIYESNYGVLQKDERFYFQIPDNPDGSLNIIFSSALNASFTVWAEAWVWNEDEKVYEHGRQQLSQGKE